MKSGRSAFSFGGGALPPPRSIPLHVPPLRSLYLCPLPRSPPIPPLPLSLPPSPWPCGAPVAGLEFCGGGRGSLLHHPPVFPLPILPPPSNLPVLLMYLSPRVCQACCLRGARAWPLGGHPPGGELTILSTILRTCSSGVPLSCSSPRWDNLSSGHQWNPLLGLKLGYVYWGQKHFSG